MRDEEHTSQSMDESTGSISLAYVLGVLRQSARWVAVFVVVATAIAASVVWMLPNRYDASATVQIDPRRKSISNVEGVVSDLKADQSTVDSEVEVVKSKEVTLKVIELLNLREDPELTGKPAWKRWLERLSGSEAKTQSNATGGTTATDSIAEVLAAYGPSIGMSRPLQRDEIAAAFSDRLRVSRVRSTTLIEIRFSSADPVKAARIANAVAEVYIKDQIDEKSRAANTAIALLEEKLTDLRRRVAEAEHKVEQFKANNNIFDSEGHVLTEKQLSRLLEQTVLARNATAEAKAKYEQAKRMIGRGGNKGDIAEVLQSNTIRQQKEELAKLTRREAELTTRYGNKHPEMQKVRAEIADATLQLNAEVERVFANLKSEYDIAEDREQQLASALVVAKEQQAQSKEALVTLNGLQRDAMTSKQLFEALLTRYKQTAETQDLQLADARIVERAGVPLSPAAPKRKLFVVGAAFAALGFAIVVAFVIDMMAPGLARAEDVRHVLEHEHLASVPMVEGSREQLRAARLMLADPDGMFAETIRGLRHEIDSGWPYQMPRVIMLASAMPNEGKSAIASNLAHHLALTGVRTLLVDADMRKASLTHVLCPAGAPLGARDCLEERRPVEDAILRDQVSGLCFLPARGPELSRLNPSELLVSPMMTGMIGRLKQHFDAIVIDCPPVLPVVDARILADFADQIVFVMTWRKTPKEMARKALRSLGANERKVMGVVLNQVEQSELSDGYRTDLHREQMLHRAA